MKRLTIFGLAVLAVVAVAAAQLSAQDQTARIAFVDSQAAINAHPAGQKAADLKQQAQSDIGDVRTKLDDLAAKARGGQTLTPAESERYQTLLSTLDALQKRYQKDITDAAQPAVDAVDAAIQQLAKDNGYTIVMDSRVAGAGGTNLVVYADPTLDITPKVIDLVKQAGASGGGDGAGAGNGGGNGNGGNTGP